MFRFKLFCALNAKLFKQFCNIKCARTISLGTPNYLRFVQFSNKNKSQNLGVLLNETEIIDLNNKNEIIPNNLIQFMEKQDDIYDEVFK